ncbi:hypothetical protein Tco_1397536, partial [Tanacetum coccineum]
GSGPALLLLLRLRFRQQGGRIVGRILVVIHFGFVVVVAKMLNIVVVVAFSIEKIKRNRRDSCMGFVEKTQALCVLRLSLAKNVAFNVLNEKTTFGLLKGLSSMYEKPSASKKVFLIKQLVNTKMTEGATVADHVNEFNSVISKLLSVDIKFDDEMQSLLLLSSLPDSWSGTVTVVSSTSGMNKLAFEGISRILGYGFGCLITGNPVDRNNEELQATS